MRPARLVLPALLIVLALAGCGRYPAQITAPGGADGATGAVVVRDARFTANPPREGDEAYATGADAPLTLTLVNTADRTDQLVAVSSPVADGADISGDTQLPGGFALVSHGSGGAAKLEATVTTDITLTDLREPLRAGLTYPVTFTFERAGAVTLELPVDNPDALPPRANDGG